MSTTKNDSECLTSKLTHDKAGTQSGSAATVTDAGIGCSALLGQFPLSDSEIHRILDKFPVPTGIVGSGCPPWVWDRAQKLGVPFPYRGIE